MPTELFTHYPTGNGHYDELLDDQKQLREHWRAFAEELQDTRPEQLRRRLDYVRHQIFENGITYNVYADPQGNERPWELDLLPLIIPPDEWKGIENAISQRATLLNRILADVYGPQRLLKDGSLPPALIHGHAGFLRPAHGIPCPDGIHLHLYAADLARSPNGRWWVIADRTQAPAGAGYALENRQLISRVFPDLFRDLRVQRLGHFFHTLQDSLAHWAPRDGQTTGSPRVVLLTPGPYNETYFEHAYLARYLGYPLVEGHDLTVRDGCVWLKTLDGLQRVHVILRRQDDDFCDPLEMRADSALGIPGLVQAARNGKVLISNALGSSLLEAGTLFGYLPKLSQKLLGEPLKMPSVATWWCGEPAALEDALSKLDKLAIQGAFPQLRFKPVFGADLNKEQRRALEAQIRARPYNYVAQELVSLAQAPTLGHDFPHQLDARAVCLRVYAVATPNGYCIMPGGLSRVASHEDARVVAMQRGGASKDTWVLTRGAIHSISLRRHEIRPQDLVHSGSNLSSRVVENLFWFGRYTERCDNIARLLRVALSRLLDEESRDQVQQRSAIITLCRNADLLPPLKRPARHRKGHHDRSVEGQLLQALLDPNHASGFAANLRHLLRIGFQLRERLSLDNWRNLNLLAQDLESLQQRQNEEEVLGEALAFLDKAVTAMMTLAGFSLDGMTRDQGWRFLSIGRRIERLQFSASVMALVAGDPTLRRGDLEWLLELADSIITYRSRYMMQPQLLPVMDLLLLDEANPRAVLFQVRGLRDYLIRLAEQFGPCGEELMDGLHQQLRGLDLAEQLAVTEGSRLSPLLGELRQAAFGLSDQLSLRFFSHVDEHWTGVD